MARSNERALNSACCPRAEIKGSRAEIAPKLNRAVCNQGGRLQHGGRSLPRGFVAELMFVPADENISKWPPASGLLLAA